MKPRLLRLTMAGLLLAAITGGTSAPAQKPGGVLRVHALDSPPSLSMPVNFSRNTFSQPAAFSWASWLVRSCASVDTRA
jgi:hypothetical protein